MFRRVALLCCVLLAGACGTSTGDGAEDGDDDQLAGDGGGPGDSGGNGDSAVADQDPTGDDDNGAVAGNGVCEPPENPLTTLQDCPTVADDGYCSTPEDAETTPQDCPAVAGDGLCTHDETFLTVPEDCPPPDFTYTGGGLAALLAVSPPLRFGALVIEGTLVLPPATTTQIMARSFRLTGRIESVYNGLCDQRDAPTLLVTASGPSTIAGVVSLPGQSGQNIAPNTTNCSCTGSDGGRFELTTSSIGFTGEFFMPGGRGSQITHDVNNETGCTGGAGGVVRINDSTLRVGAMYSGKVNLNGGRGGNNKVIVSGGSSLTIVEGGIAGVFAVNTADLTLQEHSPHASRQEAQVIGSGAIVNGVANNATDHVYGNLTDQSVWIRTPKMALLGSSVHDDIEDLYRVRNSGPTARSYTISLRYGLGSGADLDLVVLDRTAANILALSDQANNINESITITVQPNTEVIVGVSAYLGGQRAYTLKVD